MYPFNLPRFLVAVNRKNDYFEKRIMKKVFMKNHDRQKLYAEFQQAAYWLLDYLETDNCYHLKNVCKYWELSPYLADGLNRKLHRWLAESSANDKTKRQVIELANWLQRPAPRTRDAVVTEMDAIADLINWSALSKKVGYDAKARPITDDVIGYFLTGRT